jgi:excinuclease ABC subunit C
MNKYTVEESLKHLPSNSGVYEMKTENNTSLYIGKAKNLRNRVKSYFQKSNNHSSRIKKLIEKIKYVEWTETRSETEALLLENNLIKDKKPKFNILLRDDKTYAFIKITNEDFPRVIKVRKVLKDGGKYFGPKTSTTEVNKTIDLLQNIFLFRKSDLDIKEIEGRSVVSASNKKYPCLYYHLKKCHAPCIGNISKKEYGLKIEKVLLFLRGHTKEIEKSLYEEMMQTARESNFEKATKLRDYLKIIKNISEKQIISAPDNLSADVIGIYTNYGHVFFHLFSIREGKVINSETISMSIYGEDILKPVSFLSQKESLQSFLSSYKNKVSTLPKNIILDEKFFDEEEIILWQNFLENELNQSIKINIPKKGKRKELIILANQNAESYAKRHSVSFLKQEDNTQEVLETLQSQLKMETLPKRIECYDISHFSGEKTVSSMIVFENGKPKNSDYRSFTIKSLQNKEIDDFKSLAETLFRRLNKLPEKYPDNWRIEKIKRLKDFKNISVLNNDINYYSTINQSKKTYIYGFFIIDKKGTKLNKIFQNKYFIIITKDIHLNKVQLFLNNEKTQEREYFFLLKEVFEKELFLICEIITKNKLIIEYIESIGFIKYEKKWIRESKSTKNKKDSFLSIPNLIVIDGGKGQLSSTYSILKNNEYAKNIKICSIAKREEEIFSINENGEIYKTEIKKDSKEGYLLQNIRDEAHRFAIDKNRKGREISAQKSILDNIQGLGPKGKKLLKINLGSIEQIRNASDEDLLKYINIKTLKNLREVL